LERDGRSANYSVHGEVSEALVLANAPDLEIAGNSVRLEGRTYRMMLALDPDRGAPVTQFLEPDPVARLKPRATAKQLASCVGQGATPARAVTGEIRLEAAPNQSLPPSAVRGAGGWVSGYVVPVLTGTMRGTLRIGEESLILEDAVGYHDHNWGFWEG